MLRKEGIIRFRASDKLPNPLEVDYWIDMQANHYGNIIKNYDDYKLKWIVIGGGSSGTGTDNYEELENKPSIGGVILDGDVSLSMLGVLPKGDYVTTTLLSDEMKGVVKDEHYIHSENNYSNADRNRLLATYTSQLVDDKLNDYVTNAAFDNIIGEINVILDSING